MKEIENAVRELGGVWPSSEPEEVYLYQFSGGRYAAGLAGGTARYICTRTEFEECTRRLSNEPSFDDNPDAKCFVQNPHGDWFENVNTNQVNPGTRGWHSTGPGFMFVQRGEVIGDWKQTLKLRPEEEKMEDDWHKKGEFPPVGTVCEMRRRGEGFAKGSLMYHSAELCVWRFMSSAEIALRPDQCDFRPLQTERERWVEMARKATFEADEKQNYYEAIYDAGLAKMPVGE